MVSCHFYYKKKKIKKKWWPYRGMGGHLWRGCVRDTCGEVVWGTLVERLCARHLQKLDLPFYGKTTSRTWGPGSSGRRRRKRRPSLGRTGILPVRHVYACIALRTLPTHYSSLRVTNTAPKPSNTGNLWLLPGVIICALPTLRKLESNDSMNVRSETTLACFTSFTEGGKEATSPPRLLKKRWTKDTRVNFQATMFFVTHKGGTLPV